MDAQEEVPAVQENYYEVLGVERNATSEQIGTAYKTLSIKYHPDRNPDDAEAAKHYKSVNDAYNCLIDPAKRVQYDIGGVSAVNAAPTSSVDIKGMGALGRAMGSVMTTLGVQVPNQVANEFIATAQAICRTGGLNSPPGQPQPTDPRVTDVIWGCPIEGKVERQFGSFYRLIVDESTAEAGLVLSLKSARKDRFKVFVFNEEGNLFTQVQFANIVVLFKDDPRVQFCRTSLKIVGTTLARRQQCFSRHSQPSESVLLPPKNLCLPCSQDWTQWCRPRSTSLLEDTWLLSMAITSSVDPAIPIFLSRVSMTQPRFALSCMTHWHAF
jgi:hypothetical protein